MPGVVAAPKNNNSIIPLILGAGLSAYGTMMKNNDTADANIAIADTTDKNLTLDEKIGYYNSAQTEGNKLLNLKVAYANAKDDAERLKIANEAKIIRDGFLASKSFYGMTPEQQSQWMGTFGENAQYASADGTMSGVPVYGGKQYGLYSDLIGGLSAEKKANNLGMAKAKSPMGSLFSNLIPAFGLALTRRAIGPVYPGYQ